MNKEEILEFLDELVTRLEGPAVQVYELALTANIRSAIFMIIVGTILMIVGTVGFTYAWFNELAARKARDKDQDRYGRNHSFRVGSVNGNTIGGIGMLIGTIMTLIAIHNLLIVEWSTLHQIVPGL